MSSALAPTPLTIDEVALRDLANAGHRWLEGQVESIRYRWLLPPDFVLAGELPARPAGGLTPLCGGGDRSGRLTAVLGYLRGSTVPPHVLVEKGAGPGVTISSFTSRAGAVAERLERRADKQVLVTTVHAFVADGAPYRFFVATIGVAYDREALGRLRTIGTALSFAADLDVFRRGRLHG